MKMKKTQTGEWTVVTLEGELNTLTASEVEDSLKKEIACGVRKLAIDLGGVNYISSAGLRVFLIVAKQLNAESGVLRLAAMQKQVKEVFDVSGFSKILDIKTSIAEATRA
jgi:stage II sporulation protein AA (anti-sigma F factor antagonist)